MTFDQKDSRLVRRWPGTVSPPPE